MKITAFNPKDGINAAAHRKDKAFKGEYILLTGAGSEIKTLVILRHYETSGNHYVCLWVNIATTALRAHATGSARNNAGLYDATVLAARAAGFEFERVITAGPDDLLTMIAEFLGIASYTIHHAHA